MHSSFRKVLIIAGLILAVLLVLGISLPSLFEEQLSRRVITELNKRMEAELRVKTIDLTLLRSFPLVSANLRDIELEDSYGGILLEADKLSFRFALFSLLRKHYELRSIKLSGGALFLSVDEGGQPNYQVFKATESPGATSRRNSPGFHLKEAVLENMEVIYSNEQEALYFKSRLDRAVFSGAFNSKQFQLESEARFQTHFLELEGLRYLSDQDIGYEAAVAVDFEKGNYTLEQVNLRLGPNVFRLDGVIERLDDGLFYDLFAFSDDSNTEAVIDLLPTEYQAYLGDFTSKGKFELQAAVTGQSNDRMQPRMQLEFRLTDGRIKSPRLKEDMKDVSLLAKFTNGEDRNFRSSVFTLEQLSGYFMRERFQMNLLVQNMEDPRIQFRADGAIPLAAVYGLFNSPSITQGRGEIELNHIALDGRYEDMINMNRIDRVKSSGRLTFDDAALTINEETLIADRGELLLNGNELSISALKIEGAGSEFELSASAQNLIPVLFADSLNQQNAFLKFQGDLLAEELDIDRLLKATQLKLSDAYTSAIPKPTVDSLKTATQQKRTRLISLLEGTFTTQVEAFNYQKIEGADFQGALTFSKGAMDIQGQTRSMGGTIQMEGQLNFAMEQNLNTNLQFKDIELETAFKQTDNFGQQVLQARHLDGRLHALLTIEASWDEKGNFKADALKAYAGLGVVNGHLRNFDLLEQFSSFVNVRDLRNIKLVNLQNYLEVENQTLYIPAMFIQSNAMNLTVSGQHSFQNTFEYFIKVNAAQVLANRFAAYNPNLEPLKARRKGFFNLHYKVYGSIDDYQYETARREVKNAFENSEARKRRIQQELGRTFQQSIDLIDEPEGWKDADADHQVRDEKYLNFELEGGNGN